MLPTLRTLTTKAPVLKTVTLFEHLPLELQAEIFLQCLPERTRIGAYEAPFNLLQVCSLWRNLALATPRLWTSFHVDLADRQTDEHNILTLLSLWLSLSKVLPISFSVVYQRHTRRPRSSIVEHVLKELALHRERWESVHLVLSGDLVQNTLGAPQHWHEHPLLKELDLDLKGPCHLNVRGLFSTQLTTLSIWLEYDALLALDEWAVLLNQATALTRCKFNAKSAWTQQGDDLEISLLNLRRLDVAFQGDTDVINPEMAVATFLKHLDLPTLTECRLAWQVRSGGVVRADILHASLAGLLAELQPSLEVLSLAYFPLTEADLIECLASVPFLTSLILQYSLGRGENSLSDLTLMALTVPGEQSPPQHRGLLQHLQSIQIQGRHDLFSNSALTSLIKSRRGSHLHDLSYLMLKSPQADNMLPLRREWEKDGIQVSLQFVEI
jgi:hypothetical protein